MNDSYYLFNNVLLLEDDPAHVLLISRALKSFVKNQIHTVGCVKDALSFLNSEKSFSIECIISDLNVTDGKEMQVVEPIIKTCKNIPLIVLTSSTSLSTAIEAMKFGAKDYLVKNFGPDFKDTLGLSLSRVSHSLKLEKERTRLAKEMAILRLAIENGLDGVAIINKNLECVYTNSAFNEIILRLEGKITGEISNLFSGTKIIGQSKLQQQLSEILLGKNSASFWSTEILTEKSLGLAYRLELSNIEKETNWAMWLRDITESKQRERFQRDMLSTTTHDLKGPLGAILISSEMISNKNDLPERIKELALRIGSSAQGAVNIIDEFLSARRLEEGSFILKPKTNKWIKTIESLANQYQAMLKAKNISFSYEIEPNFEANYDELGMIRVLGNLLSNSIKFTPTNGTISLTVGIDTDSIVRNEYQLTFSDSGSGMEPAEVSRLFQRFSRLNKHANIEGTGLGLYVVKCIIYAHGGRISVTSSTHTGTTFLITLPMVPVTNNNGELIVLDF